MKKLTDLTPQKRNANRHTPRGMKALEESIQRDGWIGAITVAADGETFDGSARIEVGVAQGFEDAVVVETDGTKPVIVKRKDIPTADDPRAKRLGVAANRVAQIDLDWSADVLSELQEQGSILDGLFDRDELDELLKGAGKDEAKDDPGAQVDRAAELQEKWHTERGQLWQIGKHRLLCGDSTSADDVARLMGGQKAQAVVTDVPYGISQQSNGLRELDYGTWDKGDCLRVAMDALALCENIPTVTAFCGDEQLSYLFEQLKERTLRTVAWVKPNPTVLNGEHVFLPALELAAHGRKAGAWFGGKCVRSVWEGTTTRDRLHPTQKPAELMAWLCELTCPTGEIVYEPFTGSGTTMVAAEQTGRTCYGMEIEPKYVAVALERMAGMGLEPQLVSNG